MQSATYHSRSNHPATAKNPIGLLRIEGNSMKETLQGVLGSGENGVQKYREHGAKKTREQGAMENNLGSREQNILGIVSKNLHTILRTFLCLTSLGLFSPTYFAFHHQYITYFGLSPLPNVLLIQERMKEILGSREMANII